MISNFHDKLARYHHDLLISEENNIREVKESWENKGHDQSQNEFAPNQVFLYRNINIHTL